MCRPGIRVGEERRQLHRRSGTIPGRRFALALTLGVALLSAPTSNATADGSSQSIAIATVYAANGTTPDSVTLGALQQNPRCQQYSGQSMEELGRNGFVDVTLPPTGTQTGTWSLATILGCLQTPVSPSAVTGVTVMNGDGSPQEDAGAQITRADLASPSDFNDPSESPVIEDRGSVVQYDRPWRGGQSDYDFLDEVQESQDSQPAPIALDVFEGPLLTVTASASGTSVPVGATVRFQTSVSPPNQSGLSYGWDFDGGAPNSTAAAPEATFNTAGQYNITVQVTDSAGGGGGASLQITVGNQPGAATGNHSQTGSGSSRKSHTPSGPRHSSGNRPGASAGAAQGSTGSPRASSTSNSAGSDTNGSSTAGSRAGSPTVGPPRTSTPSSHVLRPDVLKAKPPPRVLSPNGPVVDGRLISDVIPLPAGASSLVRSSPSSSAPPARQAIRTSPLVALAAGLGVALLFMLGVGRELGWPLWHRLRPDK